ncbi:sigma-54-dependent transcriptional regulator [Methylotenera versatilis]|uniref:Two component, sigma54 specific, transcriptional regulator, Fis family n=1 Tax=Methylotenera versatilis (strain 301) TaxID=666681 RepID=D7DIW9_METV0|nr:two component, sigma54 specific, transcriptional regulator, Fis family [Methylotenera versatilis 301]
MQLAHHISGQPSAMLKQQSKLLIVEDEVLFARAVMRRLQKAGYECAHVESLQDARTIFKQFSPDIVLLDMRLPDGNGLDLLADLVVKNVAVIVMTAHGEISDAVNAIKQGAIDYLKKPIDLEELLLSVQKAEASAIQSNSLDYSRQRNAHAIDGVELLGDSPAMQSVIMQIQRIAQLVAADTVPPTVLISGETGTGKDVAARLLHLSCQVKGQNNDKPFVHIDCASLPPDLMESELFGHEKGAFTGASATRPGLIEAAEDGTLFLDEIGELPLALQAKLLNVLERRMVRRIGSTKERPVPARFIAATNRDLHEMSLTGSFRQDLYYRLNVMSIGMPPLRERAADILMLAKHFAIQTSRRYGLATPVFSTDAITMIKSYDWPGNVRELRHQVSRAMLLSQQGNITELDFALPMNRLLLDANQHAANTMLNSQATLDEVERAVLLKVMAESDNNVSRAARKLGITRMTMRYRLEKHQLNIKTEE